VSAQLYIDWAVDYIVKRAFPQRYRQPDEHEEVSLVVGPEVPEPAGYTALTGSPMPPRVTS
jgi:hypothetical protein